MPKSKQVIFAGISPSWNIKTHTNLLREIIKDRKYKNNITVVLNECGGIIGKKEKAIGGVLYRNKAKVGY
jgi:Mg2+/Co2+ transporter CorB